MSRLTVAPNILPGVHIRHCIRAVQSDMIDDGHKTMEGVDKLWRKKRRRPGSPCPISH